MFKNLNSEALGVSGSQSQLIEMALSFGFKGIDLDILDFTEQVKAHGLPHARRLIDSAKLKLGSFKLPVDWRGDDATFKKDLDLLPAYIATAAELGCTRVVTHVEPGCDQRPYHQNFEFHRQRLTEIAKKLEPSGIRLGVGFIAAADVRHGKAFEFIHNLDALLMLLSMVTAKNVGVSLDVWQLYAGGGSIDSLKKLTAEKIVTVQLADATNDPAAEKWHSKNRLFPGETGVIDCPAILVALAEKGYDGPVTPVPHVNRVANMRRDAIAKLAGEKLDQVWKAAGLSPAGKLAASTAKR
jgi:sugar phosphate isomerase/epimerase